LRQDKVCKWSELPLVGMIRHKATSCRSWQQSKIANCVRIIKDCQEHLMEKFYAGESWKKKLKERASGRL